MIFKQFYREILREYVNIWSKNLSMKMRKMAILITKWGFERSLLDFLASIVYFFRMKTLKKNLFLLLTLLSTLSCEAYTPNLLEGLNTRIGFNSGQGIANTGSYETLGLYYSPLPECGSFSPYFEVNGHYLNCGEWATNTGLGVQFAPCMGSTLYRGVAYYDYREFSRYEYHQVALSLERIGPCFDIRLNGYLPVGDKGHRYYNCQFDFVNIFCDHYAFNSFKGVDLSFSRSLSISESLGIYTTIGTYYFQSPHYNATDVRSGFDKTHMWGGKLAVECEVINGLILGVQGFYDTEFRGSVLAEINWYFPLAKVYCSEKEIYSYPVRRVEIMPVNKRHCSFTY